MLAFVAEEIPGACKPASCCGSNAEVVAYAVTYAVALESRAHPNGLCTDRHGAVDLYLPKMMCLNFGVGLTKYETQLQNMQRPSMDFVAGFAVSGNVLMMSRFQSFYDRHRTGPTS
jgi:hypothetical protein